MSSTPLHINLDTSILPSGSRRESPISNPVIGILFVIFTEIMLFTAFISAYSIVRSGAINWPPMGQPRLPVLTTGFNSLILIASGLILYASYRLYSREGTTAKVKNLFLLALIFGISFAVFQGFEWIRLIKFGLTMTSSVYGSFFYLIIGFHGLHVLAACLTLTWVYKRLARQSLNKGVFSATLMFWIFVVAVWPCIYFTVYF